MGKRRANTTLSADGAGRRQRAAGKSRQKTVTLAPLQLRRSPRLQARLASNLAVATPTRTPTPKPKAKPKPKPPPCSHRKPRPFRVCAAPRKYASSSASSDPPSPRPTLANYDYNRDYYPSQSIRSDDSSTVGEESTPPKIFQPARRPDHEDLILISPRGRVCVVTLEHNGNGTVEDCHLLDRACGADPVIVGGMEILMGIERGTLDVDCPRNRVFLESKMHTAMDRGKWVLMPTEEDLERMLLALQGEQLSPIEGQQEPPRRNSNGFTRHTDVFPNIIRKFYIVPLSTWAEGLKIYREREVNSREPPIMYGPPPFELIPPEDLPCDPYFVVWKAYKALIAPGVHAPAHHWPQEDLIRKIGKIMWARGLAPKA
ncbi:hypothetical protein EV715DRAFT_212414 [Schizophyllum commune]